MTLFVLQIIALGLMIVLSALAGYIVARHQFNAALETRVAAYQAQINRLRRAANKSDRELALAKTDAERARKRARA